MSDIDTAGENRFSLPRGIVGALIGAGIGVGLMFGCYSVLGFRFPLLGVGIGLLTGYGARVGFKGTDSKLGYISAALAVAAVTGTLFLMYGEFPIMSIISVIVSASFAYRLAAN